MTTGPKPRPSRFETSSRRRAGGAARCMVSATRPVSDVAGRRGSSKGPEGDRHDSDALLMSRWANRGVSQGRAVEGPVEDRALAGRALDATRRSTASAPKSRGIPRESTPRLPGMKISAENRGLGHRGLRIRRLLDAASSGRHAGVRPAAQLRFGRTADVREEVEVAVAVVVKEGGAGAVAGVAGWSLNSASPGDQEIGYCPLPADVPALPREACRERSSSAMWRMSVKSRTISLQPYHRA